MQTIKRFEIRYDWSDRFEAQRVLGIKEAQLRNDTSVILELKVPGFDYIPYKDKGYKDTALRVLIEFRKLVETKGRARAIAEIREHMEDYYERARQGSCKGC